ncbi:hypothetical protein ANTRET_LOCUS10045 [Anthophora retusa]
MRLRHRVKISTCFYHTGIQRTGTRSRVSATAGIYYLVWGHITLIAYSVTSAHVFTEIRGMLEISVNVVYMPDVKVQKKINYWTGTRRSPDNGIIRVLHSRYTDIYPR